MDAAAETHTHRLRPFWGRIMVIPSDVDSDQTDSGLILPWLADHQPVKRGIVAHVDRNTLGEQSEAMDEVGPGTIVYYVGGLPVGDAVMLLRNEIVAYEAAE